jgi:hypothetical protein
MVGLRNCFFQFLYKCEIRKISALLFDRNQTLTLRQSMLPPFAEEFENT